MKLYRSILLLILLGAVLLPAAPVSADTTIIVNTGIFEFSDDGLCSLREAILNANDDAASYPDCGGGSGTDTITFAADYTITLTNILPFVTSPIIIKGNGAARTIIQASTCNPVTLPGGCTPATYRVLLVRDSGSLTLIGLTVRHGNETDVFAGGGINNGDDGTLTIINSTISDNRGSVAGGVWNSGTTLIVRNSTISGNYADSDGGGIFNQYETFANVMNSTITGNYANGLGGGIHNRGTLRITNSTISGNSAPFFLDGGGIYNISDGKLHLTNTLIANSPLGGDCANFGAISTNIGNLVEDNFCSPAMSGDPNLGPLANNGGPTQTHALLTGSPAIDAGSDANCPTIDQRGVARPQGTHCDIGAYEYKPSVVPVPDTPTFTDVPKSHWAWEFIERLYAAGITGGCGSGTYCPGNLVTRAQMAVFLERGIHGSSYVPPVVGVGTGFGDVPTTHWAASWIKQLAAEGITGGCGGGNYCPDGAVTRAQMAIFLLRSKHGASYTPPAVGGTTGFSDVPTTYWAAAWIKQLVAEGTTSGCGAGTYCPEAPVTRAQMAVFLVRTFGLP